MLRQMLWFVCEPKSTKRCQEHRAPSWSWASTDGEISYGLNLTYEIYDNVLHSALLEAQVKTPPSIPTGYALHGFVRIKGPLREVKIAGVVDNYSPKMEAKLLIGDEVIEADLYPDNRSHKDPPGSPASHKEDLQLRGQTATEVKDVLDPLLSDPIFLLPIRSFTKQEISMLVGLLLVPCQPPKLRFQRIGAFQTTGSVNKHCILSSFPVRNQKYHEHYDGNGQCILVVV